MLTPAIISLRTLLLVVLMAATVPGYGWLQVVDDDERRKAQVRSDLIDNFGLNEMQAQASSHLYSPLRWAEKKQDALSVNDIKTIFRKAGDRFFKEYAEYHTIGALLSNGKYNCVSGTALFAVYAEYLGLSYEVIEAPFHVYMIVEHASGKRILLESTDPDGGIFVGERAIKRQEKRYWGKERNVVNPSGDKLGGISLIELAGLQFYNLAVAQFNNGNYISTRRLIAKAEALYPESERIISLKRLFESGEISALNK